MPSFYIQQGRGHRISAYYGYVEIWVTQSFLYTTGSVERTVTETTDQFFVSRRKLMILESDLPFFQYLSLPVLGLLIAPMKR